MLQLNQFPAPSAWLKANKPWLQRAERWLPVERDKVRIRCWLGSPIFWDGFEPIQLEGALQYAVILRETGRTPDEVYAGIGEGWAPPPIPVASMDRIHGRPPMHLASSAVPSPRAVESKRMRRKRARTDVLGVKGKLQIAGGWAKSLNIPQPTLVTPYLDFYVMGDPGLLTDLMRDVPALGRDHSRGLGTLVGFEIESTRIGPVVSDGRLMRPVPVEFRIGNGAVPIDPSTYMIRECGYHAPYWHRASRTNCMVPLLGAREALQEVV